MDLCRARRGDRPVSWASSARLGTKWGCFGVPLLSPVRVSPMGESAGFQIGCRSARRARRHPAQAMSPMTGCVGLIEMAERSGTQ